MHNRLAVTWVLNVDGSANARKSGAGIILKTPDDTIIKQSLRFQFQATNNEAEYEALVVELKLARSFGALRIKVFSDFQLMVNQINGEYTTKDIKMSTYMAKVKHL